MERIVAMGGNEEVRIDGRPFPCFVPEEPFNLEFTGGGVRDSSMPEVWIEIGQTAGRAPIEEGQPATLRGREISVLEVLNRKTFLIVTLGEIDPDSE